MAATARFTSSVTAMTTIVAIVASTRRTPPAGVSDSMSGQTIEMAGENLIEDVPGAADRDRRGVNHVPDRSRRDEFDGIDAGMPGSCAAVIGMGLSGIVASGPTYCQRAISAPCVCDAFAETSHPCERRSQMMQRRNIEPRSQETQ